MVGKTLGHYEILEKVGAGGMGEVFRARDTRLDRVVAVKLLPGHLSGSPDAKARFEREARVISSLNHPNICTLFDVGSEDGVEFLVMEYLTGETLLDRIRRERIPAREVLEIGAQIAGALDRAHRAGIIHRDLKPGNVMLTPDGPKLLDFGLAKLAEAAGVNAATEVFTEASAGRPLTAEGTILGTFQYMAPEQLEGKEVDERTDIFALGAVLYEMATGRRAFEGGSQASLIAAILERDPAPISSVQPMSPPALDRTVRKCLAKKPDDRWQSARDVAGELQWIAEESSQAGVPRQVSARRKSRARLAWITAGVLAAATIGLAVAVLRLSGREERVVRAYVPPPEGTIFDIDDVMPGPVSISPDGRKLAFVAQDSVGTEMLWVRAVSELSGQPLAGTEGASYPFWSPDGRMIGFFSGGKLRKIAASGGAALALCDAENGKGGTWNADGVILFTPRWNTPIYRVAAAGGESVPVTELDKERRDDSQRFPHFLPDGRRFVYFARRTPTGPEAGRGTVMLGSLDGDKPRVLFDAASGAIPASGHLLYMAGNTLLARSFDERRAVVTGDAFPLAEHVEVIVDAACGVFSVSENGVLVYQVDTPDIAAKLVWLDRKGNETGTLGEPSRYRNLAFSPDGSYLAVEDWSSGEAADLWLFDVARGIRTRFTLDPGSEEDPVWAPDGKTLYYDANTSGHYDIYRKSVEGTEEAELVFASEADKGVEAVSPDGRFLLFRQDGDIWLLPLDGSGEARPFLNGAYREYGPTFSPDGRWVAYASTESERSEVYAVPFPGPGRKYQISTEGGFYPWWRQDGREIVYGDNRSSLFAVAVEESQGSLRIDPPVPLFELEGFTNGTVFPGFQKFLGVKSGAKPTAAPLALVVNWTAELEER